MRGGSLPVVCTAAAFLVGGCSESDQLRSVRPELAVSTERLDFGPVPLGASRRFEVELRNAGARALVLDEVEIAAPFSAPGLAAAPAVAPGEGYPFDVVFTPTMLDPAAGMLILRGADQEAAVELTGSGAEGAVSVFPGRVELLGVPVGTQRTVEASFENAGLAPVTGRLVLEARAFGGFFGVDGVALGEALTLPPRGAVSVGLTYGPLEEGAHPAVLRFESCEGRCGVELSVAASASVPAIRIEPPVVELGEVGVGDRRAAVITVRNEGDRARELVDVRVLGAEALAAVPQEDLPTTLAPGGALGIELAYAPLAPQQLEATVEVELGGTEGPRRVSASVLGRASGPRFVVQPGYLNVGVVLDPRPTNRTLVALNAGSAPLEVLSVELAGDPELTLGPVPGRGVRLGPGEALPVDIGFAPTVLGSYSATVAFASSDPEAARIEVPVVAGYADRKCDLEVDPAVVGFGSVAPGFRRERSVLIRNRGEQPCRLESARLRIGSSAFEWLNPDAVPTLLEPTQTLELRLRFAPTDGSTAKNTFEIRTDEPVLPVRTVSLLGSGALHPALDVRPRILDFGPVRPSCPAERRAVRIVNVGVSPVRLGAAALERSDPEITVAGGASPAALFPGDVREIEVAYDPAAEGNHGGQLVVEAQDLPFDVVVPVLGEGDEDAVVEERFEQPEREDVDVLFVIDDSCSMNDEQASLARNFAAFIQQAELREVDFQIGITTTTVLGTGGRLVGPWLSPSVADLAAAFAFQSTVGIFGSGLEQGLEAIRGAVLRNDRGLTPNAGLFRPGADTFFIVVSDEDDGSPASVYGYASELERRFDEPGVVVIGGGRDGCESQNGRGFPAPRYHALVEALDGTELSICGDWGTTLSVVGDTVFGLANRFVLARPVDDAIPVEVTVDGRALTGGFGIEGQAVVLDDAPEPGAEIVVRYRPACGG